MPGELVAKKTFPGGGTFEIAVNDLLNEPVDCIVNAANGGLSHGGGVAAEILAEAGPEFGRECRELVERRGPIPKGQAAVTTAGRLPYKGIIHAVGPRLGDGDEESTLVSALKSAFLLAHEKGWRSLSFPAVSSGIFAVPPEVCARAYVRTAAEFFAAHPDTPLRLIRLALFKGPLVELAASRLRKSQ